MLKKLTLLFALALIFSGCTVINNQPASDTRPETEAPFTPTPTPAPTRETLDDLNAELNATVDDGGAADLKQLETDSRGL